MHIVNIILYTGDQEDGSCDPSGSPPALSTFYCYCFRSKINFLSPMELVEKPWNTHKEKTPIACYR